MSDSKSKPWPAKYINRYIRENPAPSPLVVSDKHYLDDSALADYTKSLELEWKVTNFDRR